MEAREFEVIVWGATGFTGGLVAEHFLEFTDAGGPLRWALAGRNQAKLEAVRDRLAERYEAAKDLPIVVADSHDRASLDVLAARTRVVCTTVGPYLAHGTDLVAACVAAGTHCCDLTGEVPFIRKMIDQHHAAATTARSRIVHCCGYDSVPSDLGCFVLQEKALDQTGHPVQVVRYATGPTKGGVSGGTVASMVGIITAARADRAMLGQLLDPYSLDPELSASGGGVDGRDSMGVSWSALHQQWTAPFLMAGINTRVVRRSHALLGRPWGERFSYTGVMGCGAGLGGWFRAQAARLGIGLLTLVLATGPLRWLVVRAMLPAPGQGPKRAARDAGFFRSDLIGDSKPSSGGDGGDTLVRVTVRGTGDPGYLATSRMLGQSAICLARDPLPERYGVLTPASAMGSHLVKRLARVGITFE